MKPPRIEHTKRIEPQRIERIERIERIGHTTVGGMEQSHEDNTWPAAGAVCVVTHHAHGHRVAECCSVSVHFLPGALGTP